MRHRGGGGGWRIERKKNERIDFSLNWVQLTSNLICLPQNHIVLQLQFVCHAAVGVDAGASATGGEVLM